MVYGPADAGKAQPSLCDLLGMGLLEYIQNMVGRFVIGRVNTQGPAVLQQVAGDRQQLVVPALAGGDIRLLGEEVLIVARGPDQEFAAALNRLRSLRIL